MKGHWVWLVLAAAIAVAVYFFVSGRSSRPADGAWRLSDTEIADDFDKAPPSDADMDLDTMDVSFSNKVEQTVK